MAKCARCGKSGFSLKVNDQGVCFSCLEKEISETKKQCDRAEKEAAAYKARITPELCDAEAILATVEKSKTSIAEMEKTLEIRRSEIASLDQQIAALRAERIVESDAVEMESFSLYTPKFAFASSQEYKERLDKIRDSQKQMIKDKMAVICQTGWTVNGSKAEGTKLINDMSKLLLRSFNNECDMAVNDVKFSNFDRCQDRIAKSFDTINKLGRINQMSLSFQYRQAKMDELALAYEYQCKKEEEKEALRALKEQQREEAKLAKEIEAARKEAEKEKKHYLQALEKIKAQLQACGTDEERAAVQEKQDEIINHLDELSQKMEDIDYRQANQKAGYVYIISNIGSFGEDVYKIGMTRRLDPMERIYELGDASVPFMFDVHALIFSDDAPKLEAALHQAFADKRVNSVNPRREYFRVSLDEIKRVVRENHDKTVEFTDVPDAQQYRETLRMKASS